MNIPRRWFRAGAGAAACVAAGLAMTAPAATASAQGGLQYLTQSANTGGGLGNVATILTLLSPGNSTNATGCVGLTGFTGCGFSDANVQQGQSQLRSVTEFPGLTGETFRLFFNAAEPGNDQTVTLNALVVTMYGAGSTTYTASLTPTPLTLTNALQGIGNYGYLFGLTSSSLAGFDAFLAANPMAMIGVGASLADASGGPETFSVGLGAATVVPEPSTYLLMACGLSGLLWVNRQRRKRTPTGFSAGLPS